MGILYNRLLIILNDEDPGSTYYHIALVMLRHLESLHEIPIHKLAELCDVSKSTISKFIRFIGYEDFADYRYAAVFEQNKYYNRFNYATNVMEYIEDHSIDSYIFSVQQDIAVTYEYLDWSAIDRLVLDLVHYKKIAAFGLMFSETAALDFQIKLAYNKKFIVTNLNDQKQERFIRNADEDTLLIIFSDSGQFIDKYNTIADFLDKKIFNETKAKVVLITSNPDMAQDPRVAYCIFYKKTRSICNHRILYGILTDIIAYKYWEYAQNQSLPESGA